ncbi:hypothetical protein Bequi_04160 [Brachybacterium sp. JHP9]|uniref:Growth/differentiation factor n=1 Tax=Brachybacterium equifaecis TaxID=2910770 RepID=A0ABT0QYD5_9MICO|nr:hypothetical protein [Brachybacterium equifaecis]MCL6422585.1 hypothetical protein [Brachybacterium equifaecis]
MHELTQGILLAEGSGDTQTMMLLLPFLVGPAVFGMIYMGIYRYYRNRDKRHVFERETDIKVGNLRAHDRRVGSKNRQRSPRMDGANDDSPLERVRRIDVR